MKLSVLMLAYNHERYIAQAIQSALDQKTNFDFEIVIGEDCSTDRTREIVEFFYRSHPRRIVPLFRNNNLGMIANLKSTLAQCRGSYVAWLEGDDYWISHDKLQNQVDFLDAHPDYVVCCGRARVLDETNPAAPFEYPKNLAGTYAIADLLRENFIATCTAMLRRSAVRPFPTWFSYMGMADWPLHVLACRFGKINLMDEVVSAYRLHPGGSWSSKPLASRLRAAIRVLAALNRELEFEHEHAIRKAVARYYGDWAALAWQNASRREAASCLAHALRTGWYRSREIRPTLRGLAGFTVFGSLLPTLAKAKRYLLG